MTRNSTKHNSSSQINKVNDNLFIPHYIHTLIIIIFTFFSCSNSYGQNGKIIDSKSQMPISNVNIYTYDFKYTATSDKNGKFDISNLSPIHVDTIHFSHVGYKSLSISYMTLKKKKFQICMEEKNEELNNITITSAQKDMHTHLVSHKLPPMPFAAYNYGSILLNEKVYIIGGDASFFNRKGVKESSLINQWIGFLPYMQIYDIKKKYWIISKKKFRKRAYHTVAAYNNTLFIIGGLKWSTNRKRQYFDETIEWYDCIKDSLIVDKINPHQTALPISFTYKNNIIIMGGSTKELKNGDKTYTKKVHMFNPKTGLWYELPNMISAKITQGVILEDYIYLWGKEQNHILTEIDKYDLKNGTWEHINNMPEVIDYSGITTNGENVYLYAHGYIYVYNLSKRDWKKYRTDILNIDACDMHYYNNKLFIFGGREKETINYKPVNTVYCIDLNEFEKTYFAIL